MVFKVHIIVYSVVKFIIVQCSFIDLQDLSASEQLYIILFAKRVFEVISNHVFMSSII